jgi:hypothetical protein
VNIDLTLYPHDHDSCSLANPSRIMWVSALCLNSRYGGGVKVKRERLAVDGEIGNGHTDTRNDVLGCLQRDSVMVLDGKR